jgi:hypothetical protein
MKASFSKAETEFPGWYASLQIGSNGELHQKRWKGVLAAAAAAKREQIEPFVRLAFKTKRTPSPAEIIAIREHFRGADETFLAGGNDRELQILAASASPE